METSKSNLRTGCVAVVILHVWLRPAAYACKLHRSPEVSEFVRSNLSVQYVHAAYTCIALFTFTLGLSSLRWRETRRPPSPLQKCSTTVLVRPRNFLHTTSTVRSNFRDTYNWFPDTAVPREWGSTRCADYGQEKRQIVRARMRVPAGNRSPTRVEWYVCSTPN